MDYLFWMLPLLEMFAGQADPYYKSDGLLKLQRTILLRLWMISITLPHMSLQWMNGFLPPPLWMTDGRASRLNLTFTSEQLCEYNCTFAFFCCLSFCAMPYIAPLMHPVPPQWTLARCLLPQIWLNLNSISKINTWFLLMTSTVGYA